MGMAQKKNEYTEDGFFTSDLKSADPDIYKAMHQELDIVVI